MGDEAVYVASATAEVTLSRGQRDMHDCLREESEQDIHLGRPPAGNFDDSPKRTERARLQPSSRRHSPHRALQQAHAKALNQSARGSVAQRTFARAAGGGGRNRTGVHGFAGRCMTTLPPRRRKRNEGKRMGLPSHGSWSGKRVSNSRPQPWQGCALPTELFPRRNSGFYRLRRRRVKAGRRRRHAVRPA